MYEDTIPQRYNIMYVCIHEYVRKYIMANSTHKTSMHKFTSIHNLHAYIIYIHTSFVPDWPVIYFSDVSERLRITYKYTHIHTTWGGILSYHICMSWSYYLHVCLYTYMYYIYCTYVERHTRSCIPFISQKYEIIVLHILHIYIHIYI